MYFIQPNIYSILSRGNLCVPAFPAVTEHLQQLTGKG